MANYVDHFDITTEEEESYRTYVKDRDLINPNLLRATNSCTEIGTAQWEDGSWGGGGTGDFAGATNALGKTSITIDDAPDLDLNLGWELTNSENPQNNSGLQQREIPIEPNTPCTMSCYIRGHGYFRMYLTLTNYGTYEDYIDTDEWEYHSFVSQIPDENTGRAFYAVLGTNEGGSEGTVDICGMKLEEGETATRWCPSYYDMENKHLPDQTLDLDKEETEVTSFTGFLDRFISGTRVGQWFKDFWAGCQYILHVGSLVNNCVSENPDLPLAAAQGKVLMDEITQVMSDLNELDSEISSFPYFYVEKRQAAGNMPIKVDLSTDGSTGDRQTILFFGTDNGYTDSTLIFGMITVNSGTQNAYWTGFGNPSFERSGYILTIIFPQTAYDTFTAISGRYIGAP